jgi:hypothetical protein
MGRQSGLFDCYQCDGVNKVSWLIKEQKNTAGYGRRGEQRREV